MIKRTLYFGNSAYLSVRLGQLEIRLPEVVNNSTLPDNFNESEIKRAPIEDIGVIVLDNKQITITQDAMNALLDNNVAVIACDEHRMPSGLMLPLSCNTTQSERFLPPNRGIYFAKKAVVATDYSGKNFESVVCAISSARSQLWKYGRLGKAS